MDYLKNIRTEISSYDNDHSIRFYLPQDKMSLGTIRMTKTPGPINDAYIITSMNINYLIQYIMVSNNLPIELGDAIVLTIRQHATNKLKEMLKGGE